MTYKVLPSTYIEVFKAMIESKEGISVSSQRLIFNGQRLEDGKTFLAYNIQKKSTLYLVQKPKGKKYVILEIDSVNAKLSSYVYFDVNSKS